MDEILKLQEALRQAQAQDNAHRLSEQNVVEIVSKLVAMGLIHILYSSNGKEYLTLKQLDLEIQDELLAAGGRINLSDLSALLNVDPHHIEDASQRIIAQTCLEPSDPEFIRWMQGQLITNYYLDDMAAEIDESLQEEGAITLTTLAKQYNFPVAFLLDQITLRLQSIISGQLSNGVLYTDAFVDRHHARLFGILLAVTKPTNLGELVTQYHFQLDLAITGIRQFVESKKLDGTLQGQKASMIYTPSTFSKSQQLAVEQFFTQNGYIAYTRLEQLNVRGNTKKFMKNHFSKGHALDSIYITHQLMQQMDAIAEDAIQSSTWLDIASVVPSYFSEQDTLALMRILPSVTKSSNKRGISDTKILAGTYLVSHGFIQEVLHKACEQAVALYSEQWLQSAQSPMESASDRRMNVETSPLRPAAKREKSKKGKRAQRQAQEDEEEDMVHLQEQFSLSEKELKTVLLKSVQTNEEPLSNALIQELGQLLRSEIELHCRSARTQLMQSQSASLREERETYRAEILTRFADIQMYCKGLKVIQDDPQAHKHLVRTLCTDVVFLVFVYEHMQHESLNLTPKDFLTKLHTIDKLQDVTSKSIVASHGIHKLLPMTSILRQATTECRHALNGLLDGLSSRHAEVFCEAFFTHSQTLGFSIKALDKKTLRQMIFKQKHELTAHLNEENGIQSPAEILFTTLMICCAQYLNASLHVPGRLLGTVLEALKPLLPEDMFALFFETHQQLVQQVKLGLSEESNNSEKEALQQKLEASLPQVKAYGLCPKGKVESTNDMI